MDTFFTDAYRDLPAEEIERYHRTVFLNMDSPAAERLRNEYYRTVLRRMGDGVRIGRGVTIINPERISLGDNVVISNDCTLIARSERGITLGSGARLMHRVYLDTEGADGFIEIGERVYIGTACLLHGHKGLVIGADSLLAQNITITPYSHIFEDPDKPIIAQGGHTRMVTIGRDCYLGMSVTVLYSADIGDGAVIGSGAVVVKPVPPYSVAVGVPAKVIRSRGRQVGGPASREG